MKPIIGLVAKHREVDQARTKTYISDEIKNAVFHNDGIAIGIIPSCSKITLVEQSNEKEIFKNLHKLLSKEEKEDLVQQISLCDGIILSGGKATDAYELWVARYCYEQDIPIIGICAGCNNIVRATGGTTKKVAQPDIHMQPDVDYVHSICINKDSHLLNFIGVDKIQVNSRHYNTIDDYKNLKISALDEFGNIEVVEAQNKKCYMGMRFHPESLYFKDNFHNAIFKNFINLCKK